MKKYLSLLSTLALSAVAANAQIIFNDTTDFSNWYQSGTSAGTLIKDTDLTWSGGGGTSINNVIGRSFDTTTLGIGDSITATFDLTFTATPNIFSVGLFNTTGTISGGDYAAAPYNLGTYTGYYTFLRDNAANSVARGTTGNSSSTSTPLSGGTDETLFTNSASIDYTISTPYQVDFTLTKASADQVDTLFRLLDTGDNVLYSIAGSDTTTPYDTFNGVFFRNYNSAGNVTFDSIAVTSTVPEPSIYALLAGLALCGLVIIRRSRA